MDKQIKELFNDKILAEAAKRFGVSPEKLSLLDGFESFIYEYSRDGQEYIMRISHSLRRNANLITGEIEWLNYLADNGVTAARAIPSLSGKCVEIIGETDSHFTAVSFMKAKGHSPQKEDACNALYQKMGELTGRIHRLTKNYQPSNPAFKRPEWFEETSGFAEKYLPPSEEITINKFNALHTYLKTLPRDKDEYGLVHTDFHYGNFFVDNGEITLFDFDDCQYTWFAEDIAIVLFYNIPHNCVEKEQIERVQNFYHNFMEGYTRENLLDAKWLKYIPSFLKRREMDLYIVIHRSFDLNDLDRWCQSFMTNRKDKIENDVPYIDMEF